jgi:hypothetical protein
MLNTTIVDRRSTTQEVHNHTETNVEASGSIIKENKNSRFININKSMKAFKTVFASSPFYIEIEQVNNGTVENTKYGARHTFNETYYKTIQTKISVEVKQVLVVGSDYTLEVIEVCREDVSDSYNGSTDKSKYFNIPTIL